MKIKITHEIPGKPDYKVGLIYEVSAKEAKEILDAEFGFAVKDTRKKGGSDGDGQNDSK